MDSERVLALKRDLVEVLGQDIDPARHSLGDLIRRHLVRARRRVDPALRHVSFAPDFWSGPLVASRLDELFVLVGLIEAGEDLDPYLSTRAHAPDRHPRAAQHDGDFALAAWSVHHLHFDPIDPRRPRAKDRDDALLFAVFGQDMAHLILIGTHKSFHDGKLDDAVARSRAATGHMVLSGIRAPKRPMAPRERTHLALRGLNTAATVGGRTVVGSMLGGAGNSMRTLYMADFAATRVHELDPLLDDPVQARALLGGRVPDAPRFSWHFDGTRLILFDAVSRTAFDFEDQPR